MSEKSLDKPSPLRSTIVHDTVNFIIGNKRTGNRWNMLFWLPFAVAASYAVSIAFLVALLWILAFFGIYVEDFFRPTVYQAIIAAVTYALSIVLILGASYLYDKRTISWNVIGLQRLPTWTDIGLAPALFIAYAIVLTIVLTSITAWFPGLDLTQAQDVGFKAFGSRLDNILAFITLVVVAPFAEEVLFRGYLYGKLKGYVPAIWASVATSLLFALAHFQLNVGIDVFVLSMFLCGLRSLTGSIWSGILVHMIKNGIAYYMLFISPLLGG